MADSSSSRPPLCERISHKSYFLRAVDLTILGLLFSLLLYRIQRVNENETVWVVALLCESCFLFIWLLITCIKWSPAEYKPHLHRLDKRLHDFPSVDMFVTTADPVREPPILVVNTVLSLLAVNYPANKLACYVSDDGCSPLTYFSLKEASKFAKIWVLFCKKYNVRVRAPFRYFLNPLPSSRDSEFTKDWGLMKTEYEKLSRKVEDATGDSDWLDSDNDFEAFSNTKPTEHSTIVKLVCENKEGVGDEKEVPHFVYISRGKRENYHHHYKAGAMNFLVRVSGLMTNAPYMLNVDCDMYVNEADVVRQAMCVFLQKPMNPNRCAFVQFPQDFYDSNADEFIILQSYLGRGIAGIQGPIFTGSGCFHTRKVMYGLSIDDLDDSGSLSSVATKRMLAEGSLAREFGSSKEIVKSVVEALQGKSNPQQTITNSIEIAEEVGNCHYEYQTSWSKTYWNPFERMDKLIHFSRSTSISRLYAANGTGGHGPVATMGDRHARSLFQQTKSVDGTISPKNEIQTTSGLHFHFYVGSKRLCLGIIVTLLGMHCLYTLWEFMRVGFSVQSCILDITLKLIGISKVVLIVTQKTMPESRSGSGDEPPQRIDHGLSPSSGKFEIDGSLYFLPGTFIVLVNLAAIAGYWVGLQSWSCKDGGGGSGSAEACSTQIDIQ
uniref:Glycosyltransferase 2-like domain-containing protein n=1 Tax=Brassica oleracea var. oleracea TaxID=109376 RepID=A0A0D3C3P7_BRAOL